MTKSLKRAAKQAGLKEGPQPLWKAHKSDKLKEWKDTQRGNKDLKAMNGMAGLCQVAQHIGCKLPLNRHCNKQSMQQIISTQYSQQCQVIMNTIPTSIHALVESSLKDTLIHEAWAKLM